MHVPAGGEVDPRARVVIVVFTKRKVLENGCIELEIPEAMLGRTPKPLGGCIEFGSAQTSPQAEQGRH